MALLLVLLFTAGDAFSRSPGGVRGFIMIDMGSGSDVLGGVGVSTPRFCGVKGNGHVRIGMYGRSDVRVEEMHYLLCCSGSNGGRYVKGV